MSDPPLPRVSPCLRLLREVCRRLLARFRRSPLPSPTPLLATLARWWPWPVAVGSELTAAVRLLASPDDPDHRATRVVAAGYTCGVVAWLFGTIALATLASVDSPPVSVPLVAVGTLPLAAGLGVTHVVHRLPVWRATFRRTRALGAVTTVVGLVALGGRLSPTPESAARFGAEAGHGPLADSLARHVDAARGRHTAGLTAWADAWREWFPALDRAASLLVAGVAAPESDRDRTLDRAVVTVGDAVESRAATFADDVRGPLTALYALGVLLPLALVGAVPAAAVAGVPVGPVTFVVVYDLLLPLCVAVAGARVVLARPVAFPPPAVSLDHEAVSDQTRVAVVAGVAAAVVAALAGWWLLDPWAAGVAAVGVGSGVTLTLVARPAVVLRQRVLALERGLPDALALVGRRVAAGETVETAVADVGETLSGPVGTAFTAAGRRQRTLGVGIERAFLGDRGPFVRLPTNHGRAVAALLAAAVTAGRPAGAVLLGEAQRLETLRDHERRARREVSSVTTTLSNTAAVFGPLVGGATVALAGRLDGSTATAALAGDGGVLPVPLLGTAVGGYLLALAVVLPTLATALETGLDGYGVAVRVGRTTAVATVTYLASVCATGVIL
ncbi:hypothetical protein RYH80_05605 [Halobaculum sp. MBLA0147]|uniref:hypothetical protein n=1 Tax=Halobaculum sp. MBLA0147 TaxID=3079934 RepID=UPI003525043C